MAMRAQDHIARLLKALYAKLGRSRDEQEKLALNHVIEVLEEHPYRDMTPIGQAFQALERGEHDPYGGEW